MLCIMKLWLEKTNKVHITETAEIIVIISKSANLGIRRDNATLFKSPENWNKHWKLILIKHKQKLRNLWNKLLLTHDCYFNNWKDCEEIVNVKFQNCVLNTAVPQHLKFLHVPVNSLLGRWSRRSSYFLQWSHDNCFDLTCLPSTGLSTLDI